MNAAAIGEGQFGAARGYQDFFCITYGTGVGGAIIMQNDVYRGSCFSAGEFGGIVVHPDDIRKDDPSLKNGRMIFERIKEPGVQKILDHWMEEIVHGLVTLIHIFNPSCIVLGGGIMAQEYVWKHVREKVMERIMTSFREVEILQAGLGNRAGMMGAAYLALKELQKN